MSFMNIQIGMIIDTIKNEFTTANGKFKRFKMLAHQVIHLLAKLGWIIFYDRTL